MKYATSRRKSVSGDWFSTVQIVSDDLKRESPTRDKSSALDLLWQEMSPLERPHLLSLFTMKKPGSRNPLSACSLYQTPFSMFILFEEMVLRVNQPFELVEVAPRKSQQGKNGPGTQRTYKLKCQLAGQNKTFTLFRPASLDKNFKVALKKLENDFRLPFFLSQFVEHLNSVEALLAVVNAEAKRQDPNVTTLLTIQMFVDAVYSEYVKRPSHFHNQAANNPSMPFVDIVFGRIAHTVLRYLLEYGLTPNGLGCFGQAPVIQQDIGSDSSSRHGISLTSMQDIINSIDVELATDFKSLTYTMMSLSLADSQELRLNSHLFEDDPLDWP